MLPTSAVALFCDDIREEKSGAVILIGIMGDNVSIPRPPDEADGMVGVIPRLCIYIRVNFDVSADVAPISFKVTMPDGSELDAGKIDERTIATAKSTRDKGNPMGGVVSRLKLGGLMMNKLGRMTVEANVGGQVYLAGFLNFISEETKPMDQADAP